MVHSTTPGAFRPAPPRDIYNANTDPQPDPPPPWWVFRTGRSGFRDAGLEKNTCCSSLISMKIN